MNILVRRADSNDLDKLAPLFDGYRQFYQQSSDLNVAREFLRERLARNESVIFLAEDAQEHGLGFTQLYPSFTSVGMRRIWILNDLFVTAESRGKQIGRRLLDAAREYALASGAARLELSTAKDNPAQKLYESAGYQRDNDFYFYSLALA